MKRGLVLISLSLILILSVAPISASLFSDFWNKITGKVTDNETNNTNETTTTNETNQTPIVHSPVTSCTDTEGTATEEEANPYIKGTVTDAYGSWTDYCLDETRLVEYECRIGGVNGTYVSTLGISCSLINSICKDGACVLKAPVTSTSSGGSSGGGGGGGGTVSTTTSTNSPGTSSSGAESNTSTVSGGAASSTSVIVSSSGESGDAQKTNFSVSSQNATVIGSSGIVAASSVPISTSEGKAYATNENGSKQEIKVDPTTAINSVNASIKSGTFGEVRMVEYQNKIVYEIDVTKSVRIISLIPANMTISARVDVEEGNIISVKKPWWNFLAKEN